LKALGTLGASDGPNQCEPTRIDTKGFCLLDTAFAAGAQVPLRLAPPLLKPPYQRDYMQVMSANNAVLAFLVDRVLQEGLIPEVLGCTSLPMRTCD
jgi:hypothetical protein